MQKYIKDGFFKKDKPDTATENPLKKTLKNFF